MSKWAKCTVAEANVGDIIDIGKSFGRINYIEKGNLDKLIVGVEGGGEVQVSPNDKCELYR